MTKRLDFNDPQLVTVDFDQSLPEMISTAGLVWHNPRVLNIGFVADGQGKVLVKLGLYPEGRSLRRDDDLTEPFAGGVIRPATVFECLALATKNLGCHFDCHLLALGSVGEIDGYRQCAALISHKDEGLGLGLLNPYGDGLVDDIRLLVAHQL
jgi:hypothetical protein